MAFCDTVDHVHPFLRFTVSRKVLYASFVEENFRYWSAAGFLTPPQ